MGQMEYVESIQKKAIVDHEAEVEHHKQPGKTVLAALGGAVVGWVGAFVNVVQTSLKEIENTLKEKGFATDLEAQNKALSDPKLNEEVMERMLQKGEVVRSMERIPLVALGGAVAGGAAVYCLSKSKQDQLHTQSETLSHKIAENQPTWQDKVQESHEAGEGLNR